MSREFGARVGEQSVRQAAGGVFVYIARVILIATFLLMGGISLVYIAADSLEKFNAESPIPGKKSFQIESSGIYAVSMEGEGGAECVLYRLGERVRLTDPKDVWYGAFSAERTLYLVNIDVSGSYELECKGKPEREAAVRITKGFYENAAWVLAWLTALPVGLMAGFLLLGWLFVSYAMPKGGFRAYPTADPEEIARMEREDRRRD